MDLAVRQTATRTLTVTEGHVAKYAEITGDYNPLHFDEEFAAGTPFGKLVVHGGITAGILNALVAEDLPGPGTVFMNQQLEFVAPVFIGDTIVGEVEVLKVRATKPVTQLRVEVRRGEGEVVLKGEAWCYTFPGPETAQ
ncbi:MAG: MaoC family dehydratase [Candidatus Poribacteria bacterium]